MTCSRRCSIMILKLESQLKKHFNISSSQWQRKINLKSKARSSLKLKKWSSSKKSKIIILGILGEFYETLYWLFILNRLIATNRKWEQWEKTLQCLLLRLCQQEQSKIYKMNMDHSRCLTHLFLQEEPMQLPVTALIPQVFSLQIGL